MAEDGAQLRCSETSAAIAMSIFFLRRGALRMELAWARFAASNVIISAAVVSSSSKVTEV